MRTCNDASVVHAALAVMTWLLVCCGCNVYRLAAVFIMQDVSLTEVMTGCEMRNKWVAKLRVCWATCVSVLTPGLCVCGYRYKIYAADPATLEKIEGYVDSGGCHHAHYS